MWIGSHRTLSQFKNGWSWCFKDYGKNGWSSPWQKWVELVIKRPWQKWVELTVAKMGGTQRGKNGWRW